MAVLEDEFWEADGGQFAEMRRWLDELGRGASRFTSFGAAGQSLERSLISSNILLRRTGTVTQPRILLTHIPLYRPEGTLCGRLREHSRPIRQGTGRNYQNELDEHKTRWIVERVRPSLVYS